MSSNIRLPRICLHCGMEFIAKTTVTQYCGDDCARRAYKSRIRNEKTKKVASLAQQKKHFIHEQIKNKEYLSIAETCVLLGASRMTLYRQIKNGSLPVIRLGRRTIIIRTAIDNLIKQ